MLRHDTLDVSDIQGAQSRRPASRTRTPHPFIHTFDIEQTAPARRGLNTSRCTNALNPSYNLPSYELAPAPEYRSAPRDTMWTLPQNNRKFSTRDIMSRSDVEVRSKAQLLRESMTTRDIMASNDITGPQFRIEAPSMRRTNPLSPSYVYDGGEVDQVVTRVPKHGRQYPRTPETAFSLMTKDINTASVHKTEYPKHLIKTRQANRTDDIEGNVLAHALCVRQLCLVFGNLRPHCLCTSQHDRCRA
eukprot:1715340-Pleurochrysis_carterae.AAC.1